MTVRMEIDKDLELWLGRKVTCEFLIKREAGGLSETLLNRHSEFEVPTRDQLAEFVQKVRDLVPGISSAHMWFHANWLLGMGHKVRVCVNFYGRKPTEKELVAVSRLRVEMFGDPWGEFCVESRFFSYAVRLP